MKLFLRLIIHKANMTKFSQVNWRTSTIAALWGLRNVEALHTHIINSSSLGWGFVLHAANDGLQWGLYGFASQQLGLVWSERQWYWKSDCPKSELPKLLIYSVCEMSASWMQPHEHGVSLVKGLSLRPDAKPQLVTKRERHAVQHKAIYHAVIKCLKEI